MQQLIELFYKLRFFLVFLALEGICTVLIIQNNDYQRASFLSFSSNLTGGINKSINATGDYFRLGNINEELLEENTILRRKLFNKVNKNPLFTPDSTAAHKYELIPAKVIRNSLHLRNNFITIDKGKKDGIEVGMAVISADGIVGDVKACSDEYSVLFSFLNSRLSVASQIKRTGEVCTSKWLGGDYQYADVINIPSQKLDRIRKGDSIVVYHANPLFPGNIPIGLVTEVKQDAGTNFYKVKMKLTTDFSDLRYVYVVKNKKKNELDSLENILKERFFKGKTQ